MENKFYYETTVTNELYDSMTETVKKRFILDAVNKLPMEELEKMFNIQVFDTRTDKEWFNDPKRIEKGMDLEVRKCVSISAMVEIDLNK